MQDCKLRYESFCEIVKSGTWLLRVEIKIAGLTTACAMSNAALSTASQIELY